MVVGLLVGEGGSRMCDKDPGIMLFGRGLLLALEAEAAAAADGSDQPEAAAAAEVEPAAQDEVRIIACAFCCFSFEFGGFCCFVGKRKEKIDMIGLI